MRVLSTAAIVMFAATTSLVAQTGPNPSNNTAAIAGMSESVPIKVGDATLNGVIENVAGDGQHGAVLIMTDGDVKTSETARQMAKGFAAKGIVALTYESPRMNVDEATAALEVLRHRGDVHGDQIGMVGLGSATAFTAQIAKGQNVRYAVMIGKNADPALCAKLSQKSLVVQGAKDAFSEESDKIRMSAQKKNAHLTFWLTPDDDVNGLNTPDSSLLDRIASWAIARNA